MTKLLAFFFRRARPNAHNDSLRAGFYEPQGAVSPYIAAMLPRVD